MKKIRKFKDEFSKQDPKRKTKNPGAKKKQNWHPEEKKKIDRYNYLTEEE